MTDPITIETMQPAMVEAVAVVDRTTLAFHRFATAEDLARAGYHRHSSVAAVYEERDEAMGKLDVSQHNMHVEYQRAEKYWARIQELEAQRSKPPITREDLAEELGAAYQRAGSWLDQAARALELLPCERPEPSAHDCVVCGDHWHGLRGDPVDGSTGCPWCRIEGLEAQLNQPRQRPELEAQLADMKLLRDGWKKKADGLEELAAQRYEDLAEVTRQRDEARSMVPELEALADRLADKCNALGKELAELKAQRVEALQSLERGPAAGERWQRVSKPPITREKGAAALKEAYDAVAPADWSETEWVRVWDRAVELLPCERQKIDEIHRLAGDYEDFADLIGDFRAQQRTLYELLGLPESTHLVDASYLRNHLRAMKRPDIDTVAQALWSARPHDSHWNGASEITKSVYRIEARAAIDVCCGPEQKPPPSSGMKQAGCGEATGRSHAPMDAAESTGEPRSVAGLDSRDGVHSPGPSQTHDSAARNSAGYLSREATSARVGRQGSDEQNGNPKDCTSDGSPARPASVISSWGDQPKKEVMPNSRPERVPERDTTEARPVTGAGVSAPSKRPSEASSGGKVMNIEDADTFTRKLRYLGSHIESVRKVEARDAAIAESEKQKVLLIAQRRGSIEVLWDIFDAATKGGGCIPRERCKEGLRAVLNALPPTIELPSDEELGRIALDARESLLSSMEPISTSDLGAAIRSKLGGKT
jgi:hypothetical protein